MKENLAKLLLNWYDTYGRDLPWRHKGGAHPNPYEVFVSEIMLQQTTVKTVLSYFVRFMERFPTVQALAEASEDDVYQYWQGLGYYSRARLLREAAQMVVRQYHGVFPNTVQEVSQLRGFGKYTVASFLALAYDVPETVVDGNVVRIMCRMYHLTEPVTKIYSEIRNKAEKLTDKTRAADYASAIMDLGAVICSPKNPKCSLCPWKNYCASAFSAEVEDIPLKLKIGKKNVTGKVYVICNKQGQIFLRKRTENGLLSGLYEFPWCEDGKIFSKAADSGLVVTHVFTHIRMTLQIYTFDTEKVSADGMFFTPNEENMPPLSTLMKKVWQKYQSSFLKVKS